MKFLIINVFGSGNRGDVALVESEVQELRKMSNDADISVSAVFPDTLKALIPDVRLVSCLIEMPTVCADLKASNRRSLKYPVYFGLYTISMFFQCCIALVSAFASMKGLKPLYRPEVIEEFKNADLVFLNGGESLKEGSIFLSKATFAKEMPVWWIYLFQKFWTVLIITKVFNKSLIVFPNTFGPTRTCIGRYFMKWTAKYAALFMARDSTSALTLRNLGISNVVQSSDIAILLENGGSERKYTFPNRTIGVSPGLFDLSFNSRLRNRYILSHAEVLDYLIEQEGFDVVFIPSNLRHDIESTNDLALSKTIIAKMQQKNRVRIIKAADAKEMQTLMEQIDFLISTRMHPTILASTKNLPFVSIVYDHKQLGFLAELSLNDCGLIVNEISTEKLLSKVKYVMSNQEEIRSLMSLKLSVMQKKTRERMRACIANTLSNIKE